MYYKIEYIKQGEVKEVIIRAKTLQDAYKKFRERNLGILKSISEYHKKSLSEVLDDAIDSKVDLEELVAIFEQMYVMLDAGIGIDWVLKNVYESTKNRKLKKILKNVYNDITGGFSLTSAFEKYQKDLGPLVVSMIRLGEETGDMARAVKDLATILQEILDNKRRLKKAVRYPIFVIFAMSIAFVIVILFVIPPFKSIFASLKTELPLPTRVLLWLEHALEAYGLYILGAAMFGFLVLNYFYNKNEKVRFYMDRFMLKVYIVGTVWDLAIKGRFIYVFERLMESGIPILNAIDIALNIVDNEYLKYKLSHIKYSIQRGDSITNGFKEADMFENMIIQMISAGEESGNLVTMLNKVSKYYIEKYRYLVDNISALIEPILIAAIAGFVAMLALGIFLPMWNLTEAMQ
ncbi:MAG: type II secretion system F family protein [Epsilonproteobacteria bacterium]|nr:type II secretion system F family protein [Campylobacterota bacterium]